MDSDTSPEAMPEGVSRYRIDTRISNPNSANKESAENVLGNELVSYTLPAGANTVIGAFDYKLDKKNYYHVYNSLGNHSNLEYDQVTNTVSVVFQSSYLNYKEDALITGINIVKIADGKTLWYWTDGWINPNDPNDQD